jgi:hypothetical protein
MKSSPFRLDNRIALITLEDDTGRLLKNVIRGSTPCGRGSVSN